MISKIRSSLARISFKSAIVINKLFNSSSIFSLSKPAKRCTEIIQGTFDIEDEDLIPVEDVIISLTNNGYVKRMPVDTYKSQNRGGRGVKGMSTTQDDVISSLIHMSTHDDLLIFTNQLNVVIAFLLQL